ncbi:MAG: prephenate dehydrogenase [Lachnospiraceae bacterium]|nr:prephenate dehydrogenase [Lachnospiraceae bacterium]
MKIGFIGLGLIGGSIAKRLKKVHSEYHLIAYSRTRAKLELAQADGVIDEIVDEVDEHFRDCDVIYLCTPVSFNEMYLAKLKDVIGINTIITDVGSTKAEIGECVHALGLDRQFCGGHPMAGSEKTGYENANDHLMENAFYVLTPTRQTPKAYVDILYQLALDLGATPRVLESHEHDEAVAAISHVPHLIACALVNMVKHNDHDDLMKTMAAGGFKDITRIASSSPEMWEQICMTNQAPISEFIEKYIASLQDILSDVKSGRGQGIYDLFDEARAYRNSITDSVSGPIEKAYYLYCDIVDRPGAIAEIAVLLATRSISIKNIGIIQNRNFEPGVLRIQFYDRNSLDRAREVLRQYNFLAE